MNRYNAPGIDGLSHANLHSEPTHVHCGACLDGEVPREEATLVDLPEGKGKAFICKCCMKTYKEVEKYIKPLKFYSHAA